LHSAFQSSFAENVSHKYEVKEQENVFTKQFINIFSVLNK